LSGLVSALIVAGALVWGVLHLARRLAPAHDQSDRVAKLLGIFAPAATAGDDPRSVLAWQPFVTLARQLFPSEFAAIDRAKGATFPFTGEQIQSAHARWTTEWLAWERAHDAEYKVRAAAVEHEMGANLGTPYGRARLEAVEREKLDRYQQRYEEYTRVSKALKALFPAG
jgi:hypothetical protein